MRREASNAPPPFLFWSAARDRQRPAWPAELASQPQAASSASIRRVSHPKRPPPRASRRACPALHRPGGPQKTRLTRHLRTAADIALNLVKLKGEIEFLRHGVQMPLFPPICLTSLKSQLSLFLPPRNPHARLAVLHELHFFGQEWLDALSAQAQPPKLAPLPSHALRSTDASWTWISRRTATSLHIVQQSNGAPLASERCITPSSRAPVARQRP